jgi:hypothetical protein
MSPDSPTFADPGEAKLYGELLAWLTAHDASLERVGPTWGDRQVEHVWQSEALRGCAVDPYGAPDAAPGVVWYRLRAFRDGESPWPAARGVRFDALVCLPGCPLAMSLHLGHYEVHASIPWPELRLRFAEVAPERFSQRLCGELSYDLTRQPVGSRFVAAFGTGPSPFVVRSGKDFRAELGRVARSPEEIQALMTDRLCELSNLLMPVFDRGAIREEGGVGDGRRATDREQGAARRELDAWRAEQFVFLHHYKALMHWLFVTALPAAALTPAPSLGERARRALDALLGRRREAPTPSFDRLVPPVLKPYVEREPHQIVHEQGPPCPVCHRKGTIFVGSDVRHGNPMSPASDCDMSHFYRCPHAGCEHAWEVRL